MSSTLAEAVRQIQIGNHPAARIGPQVTFDLPAAGAVILPGSFNPLHAGHCQMAELAAQWLQRPVEFELSLVNVDKPPLTENEVLRRVARFGADRPIWLTRAATFAEKSRLFPQATFLVGADTMRRIGQARYYGQDRRQLQQTCQALADRGCRFLVFGRCEQNRFFTLKDLPLPESLAQLCQEVDEARFRQDISSTQLRQQAGTSRHRPLRLRRDL